jgi:glycosyltransferase involved in cell wall biosynthesis
MEGERYNQKIGLKVLFVTTAFPRWKDDGRGYFIYEMAKAVKNAGCSVKVIAMHSPNVKKFEEIDGIQVYRPRYLPDKWEVLRKDSAGIPYAWKTYPFAKLAIFPFVLIHLITTLRYKKDVDIIHAHWTLSAAVVMLSQIFHPKPYVVTVHGSDVFQAFQNPIYKIISRVALTNSKFVITPTKVLAEKIINLGIEADRVKVISNGIRLHEYKELNRKPIILFVGSLVKLKGVYDLLEAFKMIEFPNQHIQLVIIGEGSAERELRRIARDSNIDNRVLFLGPLSHEEVIGWMKKAKILVLPSYQEGQGVVLLEAMSVGTPCIGSNVGGIPEIVNESNGWLYEVGNRIQLKEKILEAISNEELWRKKSSCCLEFIKKYSWDHVSNELIDVYIKSIQ